MVTPLITMQIHSQASAWELFYITETLSTRCLAFLQFVKFMSWRKIYLILPPQVFNYRPTEGGGRERGDGAFLPRLNSPGVDRGTCQPRGGSFTEDNGGHQSLCEGDGALECFANAESNCFSDEFWHCLLIIGCFWFCFFCKSTGVILRVILHVPKSKLVYVNCTNCSIESKLYMIKTFQFIYISTLYNCCKCLTVNKNNKINITKTCHFPFKQNRTLTFRGPIPYTENNVLTKSSKVFAWDPVFGSLKRILMLKDRPKHFAHNSLLTEPWRSFMRDYSLQMHSSGLHTEDE